MGVECGFNSSLIGFNIVRLHGWFSPAVWPLLLCGLDNEPNGTEGAKFKHLQRLWGVVLVGRQGGKSRGQRAHAHE